MLDKRGLLAQVNDPLEKEVVARVLDLAQSVLRTHQPELSDFYDPFRIALLTTLLGGIPDLKIAADGGYPGAERQRVIICPDYLDPLAEDTGLVFLALEGNFSFSRVNHRDFLGSILGLGLRREKLGDIIVSDDGAKLIAAREVGDFIRTNLIKVGRAGVQVKEITKEELLPPAPKLKEIKSTVSSLRLDAVAARAFGMSRSKMAKEIGAQKVAVNWRLCTGPAMVVKEGDIISMRGRGRAGVSAVTGRTKKGRISVVLNRYL